MSYGQNMLMSILRVFMYFMVIIFILFSMMFLFNVNLSNQYTSQCNEIISRSGGLTKTAYDKCNRLSAKYYRNFYHVSVKPDLQRSSADYKRSNKGFTDDNSQNYLNSEKSFGNDASYYLYSDVPMYGHWNFHSNHLTHKPIKESVASVIRAGSQN